MNGEMLGRMLESHINANQFEGGRQRKARYVPHLNKIFVQSYNESRREILESNALLYRERKGRYNERQETAGQYPMTIPECDVQWMYKNCPELTSGVREEVRKFWIKVYNENPEYRIG